MPANRPRPSWLTADVLPCIGAVARTTLQHNLPIPFGLKVAGYASALARSRERLRRLRKEALVLQFGPVVLAPGRIGRADNKKGDAWICSNPDQTWRRTTPCACVAALSCGWQPPARLACRCGWRRVARRRQSRRRRPRAWRARRRRVGSKCQPTRQLCFNSAKRWTRTACKPLSRLRRISAAHSRGQPPMMR